ncbi:hypothetical protein [Henriciella sp.]|uniref:hypothetical protein n=1 Tax=Henriciella sp. TaxID=1968823 RepID=UPI003C7295DA
MNRRSVLAGLGAFGMAACGGGGGASAPNAAQLGPPAPPPPPPPSPPPPPPPPPPASTSGIIWGVNGHPFQAYPGIAYDAQLDLLRDLGMTQYRVAANSGGLDRMYPLAQARGITLLPIIHPESGWKDRDPDTLYRESLEKARTISRAHRGRFPVWECGNELENYAIIQPCEYRDDNSQYPCEWGPGGGVDPLDYVGERWAKVSAVVRGLVDGVGEGDPDARRAIGTSGFGHLGAFERWRDDGVTWDITVWHDYEQVRESYLETLAGYGKPIWITEFNAGAWNAVSEDDNARQLRERIAYYRDVGPRYGVDAAFVYELLDEPYWSGPESKMGIVRMDGSDANGWRIGGLKPAGQAIRDSIG